MSTQDDDDILGVDLLEDQLDGSASKDNLLEKKPPAAATAAAATSNDDDELLDYGEDLLEEGGTEQGTDLGAEDESLLEAEAELKKGEPKAETKKSSGGSSEPVSVAIKRKEKEDDEDDDESGDGETRKRGRFENERHDVAESEDGEIPQTSATATVSRPTTFRARPTDPRPMRPYPGRPFPPSSTFPVPMRPYMPYQSHNLTLRSNKYINPQLAGQRPVAQAPPVDPTARPISATSKLRATATVFRPQQPPPIPHLASIQMPRPSPIRPASPVTFPMLPAQSAPRILQPPKPSLTPGASSGRNLPLPMPVVNRNLPQPPASPSLPTIAGGKLEVVVSNIGPNITEQSLTMLLSEAGHITSLKLDRETKSAYVKFSNPNAAIVCRRKFNRSMFEGSLITVAYPS